MDKYLMRCLNSVGKKCFVRDFAWFKEVKKTGNDAKIIELLMATYGYTDSGAKTRVWAAKRILEENASLCSCLEHIFREAKKVPQSFRERARKLWEEQQAG